MLVTHDSMQTYTPTQSLLLGLAQIPLSNTCLTSCGLTCGAFSWRASDLFLFGLAAAS